MEDPREGFEGFDNVYVWNGAPHEEDPDHTHDFDTRLYILEGEITIGMNGKTITLRKDDSISIPRGMMHSGLVGELGCSYIVGERH